MDIELFKTFLEVKNTRHFGKAAENLYLTQAAVSARVKQLEDFFGIKLFIRSRDNIQLTAEGERLVPHAETMLVAWSRARQDVALKKEQSCQFNIGTTGGLWQFALQDKLAVLHERFPELALRAEARGGEDLLRLVRERIFDMVVSYDAVNQAELTAIPLGKLKLVLASSLPEISAKNAFQSNYVYVDWGTAFEMFHAKRFADAPPALLHTNMASVAESFLKTFQGTAYLPEKLLGRAGNERLRPVEGAPGFSRDIYVVYRTNSANAELIESVIPYLQLRR
jgi:DNA-binding transcriptional LysR family regulator